MARPRPKLSLWTRIRRFFYLFSSPLKLRASIDRLRAHHKHPYLALLRLFIPLPTWYFPLPPALSIRELWGKPDLLRARRGDIHNLWSIPLWSARDTPLRSLYRLYECMASGDYIPMGTETEYFWYQSRWSLNLIPDPQDTDPIRYAILACLAEELVHAFNWRLSLGMRRDGRHLYRERDEDPYPPYDPETVAPWTKNVPPVDAQWTVGLPADVVDVAGRLVLEEGGVNETFAKRNIVTNVGWLYTI
ncbi:hypothetical protein D8B26_003740 [Coccidioides posadasii str. Silveira]|uniref:Uncharacterized protein n=3 Tax=Coccidioides posadasii TaxID=199306 RepID=E9D8P5_COCPS|nr:hypothetical protein CPC735_073640 [Coccidioides posadasii C735 delta SOWgp]EER29682.1 hypothetical protein CPC735_073640 [Coccidioides posadasii C735 delta SOWgp]EFW16929.1 conserved hypothetical protein [Coccidioides posadasii str. Silveira]QVM09074.1 hypothetical protein D8B26_003740 [Coccidioides posadasii str. Silveira]|eukprot:XP_003071827.1 hypothetical protein CPC735_073640 [Coccidioides posadasii C735 delta SOWgp]